MQENSTSESAYTTEQNEEKTPALEYIEQVLARDVDHLVVPVVWWDSPDVKVPPTEVSKEKNHLSTNFDPTWEELVDFASDHPQTIFSKIILNEVEFTDDLKIYLDKALIMWQLEIRVDQWEYVNATWMQDVRTRGFIAENPHQFEDLINYSQEKLDIARNTKELLRLMNLDDVDESSCAALIDAALTLFGGEIGSPEMKSDFETVKQVESLAGFGPMKNYFAKNGSEYFATWERNRSDQKDLEVKKSLGRQGIIGFLLEFVENETDLYLRGKKLVEKAKKTLQKKSKSRVGRLFRRGSNDLENFTNSVFSNDSATDTEQLETVAMKFQEEDKDIPHQVEHVLSHVLAVENLTDQQLVIRRRLQFVNILRLISIVSPISEGLAETSDLYHFLIHARGDIPSVMVDVVQHEALLFLQSLPPDTLFNNFDKLAHFYTEPTLSNAAELLQAVMTSPGDHEKLKQSLTTEFQKYPEPMRGSLDALLTINNPEYQSFTDLVSGAIAQYQESAAQYGPVHPVFWNRDPDFVSLSDVVSLFSKDRSVLVSSKLEERDAVLPDRVNMIYAGSNQGFNSFANIERFYSALHPEMTEPISDQTISLYFSDYFQFIFDESKREGKPCSIQNLLAYGLQKNDGDLAAAFWDVAITSKIFTRNNLITFDDLSDAVSTGILPTLLISDSFSSGYTARDLYQIFPLPQYSGDWNLPVFPEGEGGSKDADVANEAGMVYHLLFLIALTSNFSTSLVDLGFLQDWLTSLNVSQHGSYKLDQQLSYLLKNSAQIDSVLTSLPAHSTATESVETTSSHAISIVQLQPFDPRFFDKTETDSALSPLFDGKVISLTLNGETQFASMKGSIINPYIVLGPTQESVDQPVTMRELSSSVRIDASILNKAQSIHAVQTLSDTQQNFSLPDRPEVRYELFFQYLDAYTSQLGEQISNIPVEMNNLLQDRSFYEYLAHIKRFDLILDFPSIFSSFYHDQDTMSLILSSRENIDFFLESYEHIKQSFDFSAIEIFSHLKTVQPLHWRMIVFDHLNVFAPLLSEEFLSDLLPDDTLDLTERNIFLVLGWADALHIKAELIHRVLVKTQPNNWQEIESKYPDFFDPANAIQVSEP